MYDKSLAASHSTTPALLVWVADALKASICTAEFEVVRIAVHGTVSDEEIATLMVSGGNSPEVGPSSHLTWLDFTPLSIGQNVKVLFASAGATFPAGKTIDELYPEDEADEDVGAPSSDDAIAHAKNQPRLREGYELLYTASDGSIFSGKTSPGDHGFGFSVTKNPLRHDRARMSLDSYSLEMLQNHGPMRDLAEFTMVPGSWVEFSISATY